MNRVFARREFFTVPDGTQVSPFPNSTDATQADVPWGALGEVSIAAGRIAPGVHSWVHAYPAVTQVTYVLNGNLTVRMQDSSAAEPYDLQLHEGQAAISQPGALF